MLPAALPASSRFLEFELRSVGEFNVPAQRLYSKHILILQKVGNCILMNIICLPDHDAVSLPPESV